jgi:hypothetical protein
MNGQDWHMYAQVDFGQRSGTRTLNATTLHGWVCHAPHATTIEQAQAPAHI